MNGLSDAELEDIARHAGWATTLGAKSIVLDLVGEVRRLRDENRRLRDNADVNTGRVRALRGLLRGARDEVDRLADAIQDHYRRMDSDREALGYGKHHPIDLDLWAALDQEDDR